MKNKRKIRRGAAMFMALVLTGMTLFSGYGMAEDQQQKELQSEQYAEHSDRLFADAEEPSTEAQKVTDKPEAGAPEAAGKPEAGTPEAAGKSEASAPETADKSETSVPETTDKAEASASEPAGKSEANVPEIADKAEVSVQETADNQAPNTSTGSNSENADGSRPNAPGTAEKPEVNAPETADTSQEDGADNSGVSETPAPENEGNADAAASGEGDEELQSELSSEPQSEAESEFSMEPQSEALTEGETETEEEAGFAQIVSVGGMKISVKAPAGVFPAGSTLAVKQVPLEKRAEDAAGIEDPFDSNGSEDTEIVAKEFAYDISVLDAEGNEIEPDITKGKAELSFESDLIGNDNLDTDVIHVVDGVEEKMELSVKDDLAIAQTESFSLYIVRFLYGEKEYALVDETSIALRTILDAVGLSGQIENAVSSNPAFMSIDPEDWMLYITNVSNAREVLTVTLDEVEYRIRIVTDSYYGLRFEDGTLILQIGMDPRDEDLAKYGRVVKTYVMDPNKTAPWRRDSTTQLITRLIVRSYTISPAEGNIFSAIPNVKEMDLSGLDVSRLTSMSAFLANDSALETVTFGGIDTSNITGVQILFYGCRALKRVDMSGLDFSKLNESGTTSYPFNEVFANGMCPELTEVNLSGTKFGSYNLTRTFSGCQKLQQVDFSGAQMEQVKSLELLFNECTSLEKVDFTGTKVEALTNLYGLFYNCQSLETVDLSDLKLENAITMGYLFYGCSALTSVDFSDRYLPNLTAQNRMFYNCSALEKVSFSGTKMPKLNNVDTMYGNCNALKELDYSNAVLGNADYSKLLGSVSSDTRTVLEKADFSNADLSALTSMDRLFYGCKHLREVSFAGVDNRNVSSMSEMFQNCVKIRKLTLGEHFQFTGDSSLPLGWKNTRTKEAVADLWNTYEGETMYGKYIRTLALLQNEDFDLVEYDAENREISVIATSRAGAHPAPLSAEPIFGSLQIDPLLVGKNAALKNELDRHITDRAYTLNICGRTYADILSCSKGQKVIWTFDVPKNNTAVIRMDLYGSQSGNIPPYTKYAGYIINSKEAPDVFRYYDASGTLQEVLYPNARHTLRELGYSSGWSDSQLDSYVYPVYEQYITYMPEMNNYEVGMAPGRYQINTKLRSVTIKADPDASLAYTFLVNPDAAAAEPEEEELENVEASLFNQVYQVAVDHADFDDNSSEAFEKRAAKGGSYVSGPVYSFTSHLTGNVYYGRTKVTPHGNGTIGIEFGKNAAGETVPVSSNLYTSVNGLDNYQYMYLPKLHETFTAKEVESIPGFYLSDETAEITFWKDNYSYHGAYSARIVYSDAVTISENLDRIRLDEHAKPTSPAGTCYTCMAYGSQCTCRKFGSCRCTCCGVNAYYDLRDEDMVTVYDMNWPQLSIRKEGVGGAVSGAVLQLIEKESKEIVLEWTTAGGRVISFVDSEYAASQNINQGLVLDRGESKTFILHEKSAPEPYRVAQDIEFTMKWDENQYVTMNDPLDAYTLTVKKSGISSTPAFSNRDFRYTVSFKNETVDLTKFPMTYRKSDGTSGKIVLGADMTYSFTLKAGQEIRLENVINKTAYEVTEEKEEAYTSKAENAKNQIKGADQTVTFVNTQIAALPVAGGNGQRQMAALGMLFALLTGLLYAGQRICRV